jgi:hypothetical protein
MNGMVRTVASITQAVAPAIVTSLFSFSAKSNILGGYAVYGILLALSCFALFFALKLPDNPCPLWEGVDDSIDLVED